MPKSAHQVTIELLHAENKRLREQNAALRKTIADSKRKRREYRIQDDPMLCSLAQGAEW